MLLECQRHDIALRASLAWLAVGPKGHNCKTKYSRASIAKNLYSEHWINWLLSVQEELYTLLTTQADHPCWPNLLTTSTRLNFYEEDFIVACQLIGAPANYSPGCDNRPRGAPQARHIVACANRRACGWARRTQQQDKVFACVNRLSTNLHSFGTKSIFFSF